jgi:hypothetical protein
MQITQFKDIWGNTPLKDLSVDDFLQNVKLGTWESAIEAIRSEPREDIQAELKKKLPCFTISGSFKGRGQSNLNKHSGFISMDFDKLDNIQNMYDKVKSDPYTYSISLSSRGNGFFTIVKIDPTKHEESFNWLERYYYKEYGLSVDGAPKNVGSVRYASFDPNTEINYKSKVSGSKKEPKTPLKSVNMVFTNNEIDELIKEALDNKVNLCESYQEWRDVGFALVDKFNQSGREYFHALSSMSSKYSPKQTDRQFDRCLKGKRDGITIGTLYYKLKQAGITFPQRQDKDQIKFKRAVIQKKNGISKENQIESLMELDGATKEEATQIVEAISEVKNLKDIGDEYSDLILAVREWVRLNAPVYRNEITGHYMQGDKLMMGGYLNKVLTDCRLAINDRNISAKFFNETILSHNSPSVNPLKEGLSVDVPYTDELERLCDTIVTDDPMAKKFIYKWCLSLIASIEGHPVRLVLALTGGQYTGKTEWFRRLCPNWLKPYYGESKLNDGKDDRILMTEKLILLDDEGGGKSAKDAKAYKELTSKDVFNLRKPYDTCNGDYKRLSVLCVTSNDPQVINDNTGNTRILPIDVRSINHDLYNSIDKDALFCQLRDLYLENPNSWQFDAVERGALQTESAKFEVENVERQLLLSFFEIAKGKEGLVQLTAGEVKGKIEMWSNYRIKSERKFFGELRSLFGESRRSCRRDGGNANDYYHLRILKDYEKNKVYFEL